MKTGKLCILLIILNITIVLGTLMGCTQIKDSIEGLLGQTGNVQGETVSPDPTPGAVSEDTTPFLQETPTPSSASAVTPPSVSTPTPSPKAAPTPTKAANSGTSSVSSMEELSSIVVSHIQQGSELTVKLGGDMQKEGIIDKVNMIIDDYGYSGYISGMEYSIDNSTLYIKFKYKGGREHFLSRISAVDSEVNAIVKAVIKPGMSEYGKELALHDYVVNKVRYDYKNVQNNTIPDDSYTAYGALINGTAVCQGYAEAMYRLLNKVGVKAVIVSGTGNGVAHAWNIVSIGGAYYHLDATFDDPVSSSGNVLTYNYFNLPDAQMSKDHTWKTVNYPKCSSTTANYFVVNKLIANNKDEFYDIVKRGLLDKLGVIRCKTAEYDPETYTPHIISKILQDDPNINYLDLGNGYSYDYDKGSSIMVFYIKYK